MDTTSVIHLKSPPLPFFIEALQLEILKGNSYPARSNLGFFNLIYVRKGLLTMTEQHASYSIKSGEYILLRPDTICVEGIICDSDTIVEEIQFSTTAAWEEVNVDTAPQLFGDYYSHILHIKKTDSIKQKKKWESALDKLKKAAVSGKAESFIQRQQHFTTLISYLDDEWRKYDAKSTVLVAEKAAACIKEHFADNLTNTMLAKEIGYHINYIARSMDEVFSMTPQQFLMYYRIDQAKLMLIHTDKSIAQIANAVGFKQTPHFSRLFAYYVGITPLKFRKKYTV